MLSEARRPSFGAVVSVCGLATSPESHSDGDSHHRFSGKVSFNRRLSVVGDIPIEVSDGLDVGVVWGCE